MYRMCSTLRYCFRGAGGIASVSRGELVVHIDVTVRPDERTGGGCCEQREAELSLQRAPALQDGRERTY